VTRPLSADPAAGAKPGSADREGAEAGTDSEGAEASADSEGAEAGTDSEGADPAGAGPDGSDPGSASPAGTGPAGTGLGEADLVGMDLVGMDLVTGIGDVTPEGAAALAAIAGDPGRALIALDFDGTLAPIVSEPSEARPQPGALAALQRLATAVGTLAIVTGRPASVAVELGGLAGIPGLIVIGHHGWERWEGGELTSPPPPPEVALARERLPEALAEAGAPDGTWVEDKSHALVVHTRRTADPEAALALLADPLADFADQTGLDSKPGRLVIELRARGVDKGIAITTLAAERNPAAVLFAGDDLGDIPAFEAVHALRDSGRAGVAVCSASGEVTTLAAHADLVVDGPAGITALLVRLADAVQPSPAH
jgi:trehalose 6-phosphate phosphatase